MKRLGKISISLLICAIFICPATSGLKICFGADGHVAIEEEASNCYPDTHDEHKEDHDSTEDKTFCMDDHCIDIPLSIVTPAKTTTPQTFKASYIKLQCIAHRTFDKEHRSTFVVKHTSQKTAPSELAKLQTVIILV